MSRTRMAQGLSRLIVTAAAALMGLCATAQAASKADIPFETFTLPNGLTVIVHEDRKAPIVAVNVWYHVGSKDEPADRTEFAHLFEHLMFQGSEHYNHEFFKPFEQVGATDQNGTTDSDRTNYFQNVPTTALDMALWFESDRMGHLLGVIDQARLDEQRDVVRNEKRQRENQPYGRVWDALFAASFPAGHPYHEEMLDPDVLLEGATLDEVKDWFRTRYGAANATLVLAGDIDLATAKEKVAKYFAHIPAGPPQTRHEAWVAARTETTRDVMIDRVAQPRIYRAWNVPGYGDPDNELLALASQVLGGSAASRLDARLVHQDRIADSVSAFSFPLEIAGLFILQADVKQGVEPARVEAVLEEELARLIKEGPTAAELERAKTSFRAGFVRGIERIGGFGGKADALAECQVYTGDPGCFRESLARIDAATAEQVRESLARNLARGDHVLTILPFGNPAAAGTSAIDRKAGPPKVESFPDLKFPALQRAKLSNGIEVVLAERHETPVVQVQLLFDAGYAADPQAKRGISSFTMGMLDESAGDYTALEFRERAEELGAQLGASSGVDTSTAGLSALSDKLEPSLDLFADMVLRPRFEPSELERVRAQWIAGIAQEKTQPQGIALRLLPPLLYGEGHAYAMPFSGSGTEASIAALTREELQAFHRDWVRPDNAKVLVVGDTTLKDMVPLLEKHFGNWKPASGERPRKDVATVALPSAQRVFLIDKPHAEQTTIIGGVLAPSPKVPNHLEIGTMNAVIGGMFTSRLNMNLREDKHWSYGVDTVFGGAVNQRPYLLLAPVQTDRTVEALGEIRKELQAYIGDKPATAQEIRDAKDSDIRGLPGQFETGAAVLGSIRNIVVYGRPDDYITTLRARLEAQRDDDVRAAAREVLQPDRYTWVIVGDLSKIEQPIRALKLGEVKVMDVDGRIVR